MLKLILSIFSVIILISFIARAQLGGPADRINLSAQYKPPAKDLHTILAEVNLSDLNSSCPECNLRLSALSKKANKLQGEVHTLSLEIKKRFQLTQSSKTEMSTLELAQQVADQVRLLQYEVDRQKILNQIKQIKLNACNTKTELKEVQPYPQ